MLISICRRRILCFSHKFQLQNELSPPVIKLFPSRFSGLSPEAATADPSSCDRKQKNAQAVITLLRNNGFSNTQISKLVKGRPQILSADPKNTLLPKIKFLTSIGISTTHLPAIVIRTPSLLASSLEKMLVPSYKFLKSTLLSDEIVARSVKRDSKILVNVVGGPVALNLDVLRGVGVPQSHISFMLLHLTSVAYQKHEKFKRCVDDVVKMGFDPLKSLFLNAVQVRCESSKPKWDRKVEVYRSWGLSDEEILLAFKKHPVCMSLSDEKITRAMDFLVNKMSWKPAIIVRYPPVIFYNLEKRIIPRCRVIKALMSKGLIKKTLAPSSILVPTEKKFLDKFVRKYQDDLPGLIKLYRGKSVLLES